MDPHSFSLLDPDPHSICGSGSRRVNLSTKNRKNARKLLITASLLSFLKVNLIKLHCFLFLSNLLCFYNLKNSSWFFSSSKLVKLDLDLDLDLDLVPDPHSEKLLDPDPNKMNADPQPRTLAILMGPQQPFCDLGCPLVILIERMWPHMTSVDLSWTLMTSYDLSWPHRTSCDFRRHPVTLAKLMGPKQPFLIRPLVTISDDPSWTHMALVDMTSCSLSRPSVTSFDQSRHMSSAIYCKIG